MADQVSIGEYTLEINGDGLLVRDESGAIVEAVDLDEIDSELTLPDGRTVDLASIFAGAGIDAFQTAAGPANDNMGYINGGSGVFTPFQGTQDGRGGVDPAGTLDETSLAFDASAEVGRPANDSEPPQEIRSSFDWSRHEIDLDGNETPGNSAGLQNQSGILQSSSDDEDDDVAPPSGLPAENDELSAPGNQAAPSTPPTGQGYTPPEQRQDEGEDPIDPPADEQQSKDVNAAPTGVDLTGSSVVENIAGAIIGTLSVVDPDADESHSFAVSDERFEIANGQLKLKDGVSLDFETAARVEVTVTATDKAGNQLAEIFTIGVTDANEAPTAVHLSNLTVNENSAGAIIGSLATDDPDAGETFTYDVSDSRFEIVGGQLQLKSGVSLDHETEPTVSLKITSTDSAGHSLEQSFTVVVANVNEAPVVTATGGSFDTGNTSFQPSVDFSDVDSQTLSQAVIHTTGFQLGDTLNVPATSLFHVAIDHGAADYTITIVGKTGNEAIDDYEDFANSISFSTSSDVQGDRHIEYSVTDSGGATSHVSSAAIAVASSQELYTSQLGKGQTTLGAGDDLVHIDTNSFSPVRMGDGYDTVHLAKSNRSFDHNDATKLEDVEAIDASGYGANTVSLSIHDVLNMTDADNRLTIVGDKGDTVSLTGSGGNHWTIIESSAEFTTYTYSDPSMQAVVEISNQLNAQVSQLP